MKRVSDMRFPSILEYFIGLDLARARDFSAIAVAGLYHETHGDFDRVRYCQPTRPALHLGALRRIPLGTEYIEVVQQLRRLVERLRAQYGYGHPLPRIHVVLDSAGPGHVVLELLRAEQLSVNLVPVLMTAGSDVGHSSGRTTVPRKDIVSNIRYLLETELLRIDKSLAHAHILEREIAAVRPHGGQYPHDDLAIAAGLATWYATRIHRQLIRPIRAA